MDNQRRKRKVNRKRRDGFFSKLFAHTGGNPEAIENQDWYLDSPDLRLTRIFSTVLILHIIAVAGILACKMIGKASGPDSNILAQAKSVPRQATMEQKVLAGKIGNTPLTVNVPNITINAREDRYGVIPGDTLSDIAVKLGVTTNDLKMTNHITSPDEIIPGMWLKIPVPVVLNPAEVKDYDRLPDHPVKISAREPDLMKQSVESRVVKVYQVQSGDTAWGIAQMKGVQLDELLRLNDIKRPELLQVGQLLKIPGK